MKGLGLKFGNILLKYNQTFGSEDFEKPNKIKISDHPNTQFNFIFL